MDSWTTFTSCDRAREAVSRELDGELSPFESRLLSAHLGRCAQCRAFGAEVVGATRALRDAPLEQLEQPLTLPRRRALRPVHGSAAAALAAAAVLVLSVAGPVDLEGDADRLGAPASPQPTRIVEDGEVFPADFIQRGPSQNSEDVALPE